MGNLRNIFQKETIVTDESFKHFENFIKQLPTKFPFFKHTIYARRNILKTTQFQGENLVVKSFQIPHLLNKIVYGTIRKSKAQRSFEYAQKLKSLGICTPQPVGYYEIQNGLLFGTSYYVSQLSKCRYTINDLVVQNDFPEREQILADLALFTAKLHDLGILHLDYSAENILFDRIDDKTRLELVDLNRMRFCKIDLQIGCQNFERLNFDSESLTLLAKVYAKARHFDENICIKNILSMRWHKHQK